MVISQAEYVPAEEAVSLMARAAALVEARALPAEEIPHAAVLASVSASSAEAV